MFTITTNHCLPENIAIEASFYERLKAFVCQYEKIIEERSKATGKYAEAEKKRKLSVVEAYVYSPGHCNPLSKEEIAKIINTSDETVRLKQTAFCEDCRKMLINGETLEGVSADSQLICDIKSIADNLGSTVTLDTFKIKSGIENYDERTLLFFSDLLGMKQSDKKPYEKIVSTYKVDIISKNYDTFLSYFREHVINIRYKEDFLPYLNETFKDEKLREAFNSLVCHSREFIWDTKDGIDYVALRWDKLRDRAPRVCWILYELGANSIKTAVRDEDVRKIYSRYTKRFGIKNDHINAMLLQPGQRERCWKPYPLGKTMFWMNRESKRFEYNLEQYARDFVQKHPGDLEGFKQQAEADGYTRLYKSSGTIPDAFYKVGGIVEHRKSRKMAAGRTCYSDSEKGIILNIVKMILEEEKMPMFQTDLQEEVLTKFPNLNEQTLRCWIKNKTDIFKYSSQSGRNSAIVSLVGMNDCEKPRTYRQKIKDDAVKYLLKKKDYRDEKLAVYRYFRKDIPEGINSDSALSAIFGDKELFNRDDSIIGLTDYVIKEEQAKATSISDDIKPQKVENIKFYTPEYDWESLKPILYKELHAVFRIDPSFNLDKSLETMFQIMAFGDKKISKNSIFHGLLSALPDFFKKELAEDRKLALKNNCDICIEPYLKSFYALKYGRDLVSDIVYDYHLPNNGAGLGTICEYLENNLSILPYKQFYSKYSLELYIKNCINESKSKRNIEIGHAEKFVDRSDYSVINRVCEVFSVFVYIASKF